ncbi:WecB/TagA/CpsF family glycosyltransferase [Qipengyuania atrilutea]|uniref:WecB/TagA/CpsF family glycosyltransferase n=1 Tax=Qipengyuania atrilutea TaxID=2744473 RepID=A0A850H7H9_9SPHN|nr:WecB/TagA/CpsF family glycosyltransferase [Actirhodobacter atriluteus]NVD45753.1 WecB/TagA/CpsF family glycosyltransferase [Actirhodobacter atriluteus]
MTSSTRAARTEFLGLPFDHLNQTETLEEIQRLAGTRKFAFVVTPNVDHVVRLHDLPRDASLWQIYRAADICVCDSQILRSLANASDIDLPLVTGSDLTRRVIEEASRAGTTATFAIVGGDQELLSELTRTYPTIRWTQQIPPMGVAKNVEAQREIAEFVEASDAQIVFFAIGSPQSEIVCSLIAERGKASGVGLCIGASLEFITGAKQRAPSFMQKLRAEWLFRLLSEPNRLWRRYLVQGPKIFLIWREWNNGRSTRTHVRS